MTRLLQSMIGLFAIVGTSALHIAWTTIAPYPINRINITIIVLVYLLIIGRPTIAVATALSVGLVMELYAVTPFGLLLSSLTFALLAGMLLASYILTTNSFWGGVALCFLLVVISRIVFIASFALLALVSETVTVMSVQTFEYLVVESIITTLCGALVLTIAPLPHRHTTIRMTDSYGARA